MPDKRIPWWEPQIGNAELPFIRQSLDAHFPNMGPLAASFERQIAERLGVSHAVAVTSGTIAIFAALKASGVTRGDEVIVPDMTFIATANAVELCGAQPVLVDVNPETLTMDPTALEQAVTSKTKAVVPVHVSGRGADMEAINRIAAAHGIVVIEDAAEALMSKHAGQFLGTFGAAGCFSFSAYKTITAGQGGMVVTNDAALAERIRALRNQGITGRGTGGDDLHPTVGYNFKWTDIQAGVALGQLTFLDERIERMRCIRKIYGREFASVPEITLYPFDLRDGAVPQWTDVRADRRDALQAHLRSKNMEGRRFWHPLHRQEPYKRSDAEFPNSTVAAPASFWLPSAFTLTDEDVMSVCREIKIFYGH